MDFAKKVWVVKPNDRVDGRDEKIRQGYILDPLYEDENDEYWVHLKIVSYRDEAFEVWESFAEYIKVKYIFKVTMPIEDWYVVGDPAKLFSETEPSFWNDIPFESTDVSWTAKSPKANFEENTDVPDPEKTRKKYGFNRDLTTEDVREIVRKWQVYKSRGHSILSFHESNPEYSQKFAYNTLRSWIYDKRFNSKD